jgi:hypothetical protein
MVNKSWNLESFLDSLIIELDKARETLAVKAINKPLTYAVKDVDFQLQLFPVFDGKQVKFTTAEQGQSGASKLSIQLASITDQQIKKTTREPMSKDDISIEVIEDIDEETKHTLKKIGIESVKDLENVEKKNVDIEKLSNKKVSYSKLAHMLKKARRSSLPPKVSRASLSMSEQKSLIEIDGENLAVEEKFEPVAVVNGKLAEIISSSKDKIGIKIDPSLLAKKENELVIVLDPYSVFKINIQNPGKI